MQIIQASDGRYFAVTETGSPDLAHVWNGVEVKRITNGWVSKKNARQQLVRKAATRIVEAA